MNMHLSLELERLAEEFGGPRASPSHDRRAVAQTLVGLRDMARLLERELEAYRRLEDDRRGRSFLEAEAASVLLREATRQDGNLLRPDFGGRRT